METVKFISMADSSQEDYQLLKSLHARDKQELPQRLIEALKSLKDSRSGYQVSRYEHSLQTATRAYRAKESEELVVAALLHDIGDNLAPYNHSELAAIVLKPYVSEKTHWIIKHHGIFQLYYYGHHIGQDRNARDRYKDHPYYQATVDFCEKYDQNSFDPNYDSLSLDFFAPMVERILAKPLNTYW